MSTATTQGVRVDVQTTWVPERSDTTRSVYFFAYQVTITNTSMEVVQLKTRHWIIEDGNGHTEHVRGPGVIGETPILMPGQRFTYTSFCPLPTPVGTMRGTYQMIYRERPDEGFDAEIAPFTLVVPAMLN